MYKRLSGFVVSVFSVIVSYSQLSVSLHEPTSGIVQRSQLWNMTLIYSGNSSMDITIALSLFDAADDQPVMTAYTRPVTITNGVKQLKASDVEPVDYKYLSPAFDISRLPDGFLPVGNYRACYTFSGGHMESVVLSENCVDFEVSPLSPPQLNLPSDSAALETPYPQFNWLPPTPVVLFTDLNYDLLVTEVQAGQTPNEAIQENLPVYSALHLTSMVNNYPASNKSLDTGKVYAWRIVAKNGEAFTGQSDVWTFKVASKKPEQLVPANGFYLELKSENDFTSTATIPNNILGIRFYSYDQTHSANIRFLDTRGQLLQEKSQIIQYGNNFIVFKLDHSFADNQPYSIEMTDLQNSHYKASFKISK